MWHAASAFICIMGLLAAGATAGPIELRLPPDLVFDRTVGADGAVTFRHSMHVGFAEGRCGPCHPAPFKILRPSRQTSHDLMDAGRSCGTCHDGRGAFATNQDQLCARCHTAWGKTQEEYPPSIAFRDNADSPGPVTFRHSTHGGPGVSCGECHLPRFACQGTGAPARATPGPHDTCGTCHDGARAFALADDAGCPRCHAAKETGR